MSAIKVNDQYPFKFETVQVDEQGQIIERKQGRAFAFHELLADEIGLEMVAIPGGEFIMGSPESEHKRSEDENSQHLVTVQSFFMGKYPITEAQWHAISDTLPVERELDLNSCGLGEEDLPVEEMYWGKLRYCTNGFRVVCEIPRTP
jgi:formylglycine-generating enzyme required for sulfatase activity